MRVDGEANAFGDTVEGNLEPLVGEGLHPPAVVADDVVVVLAVRSPGLEARRPGSEIDPLDEPHLHEHVERAVDAGEADGPTGGASAVEHFLRRQAARFGTEETDHRSARAATAETPLAQGVVRMRDPVEIHGSEMIAILIPARLGLP